LGSKVTLIYNLSISLINSRLKKTFIFENIWGFLQKKFDQQFLKLSVTLRECGPELVRWQLKLISVQKNLTVKYIFLWSNMIKTYNEIYFVTRVRFKPNNIRGLVTKSTYFAQLQNPGPDKRFFQIETQ